MQNAITFQMRKEPHPRRPRGSQSGRVKRRDESFQAWRLFRPWLKTFVEHPTDCPWVSEDERASAPMRTSIAEKFGGQMEQLTSRILMIEPVTLTAALLWRESPHSSIKCSFILLVKT